MMGQGRTYDFASLNKPPDTEAGWYIIQCMATTELAVAAQLNAIVPKTPGAWEAIDEIKVPTREAGDSRGTKTFTTPKALYPSYIFVKMRLCKETYTGILSCNRVASFVGGRQSIGGGRSMVLPEMLSADEVGRFEGLESSVSASDKKAFEYDIGEMVRITTGNYKDETGAVRMVRDGQLVVRLWTYGTMLDVYLDPLGVRHLDEAETAAIADKGMDGPSRPVGQDEFDEATGEKPFRKKVYSENDPNDPRKDERFQREKAERRAIYENAGSGGKRRERREDRAGRGDSSGGRSGRGEQRSNSSPTGEVDWKSFASTDSSRPGGAAAKGTARRGSEVRDSQAERFTERRGNEIRDSPAPARRGSEIRDSPAPPRRGGEIQDSPAPPREKRGHFGKVSERRAKEREQAAGGGGGGGGGSRAAEPADSPTSSAEDDFFKDLMGELGGELDGE